MERKFVLAVMFAALICVLSLLPKFMMPFGVPITAQSLGIMLAGAVLGARYGTMAVAIFLAVVALGAPLTSRGGGIGVFFGPTGGYLIGFLIGAFVIGLVMSKLRSGVAVSAFIASVIGGIGVVYICGIIGLHYVAGMAWIDAINVNWIFVPGDLVKAALTAIVTAQIYKFRPEAVLSRA